MSKFVAWRLLQGVIAVLFIVTVVFALGRATGDPAALLAPPQATPADIAALRHSLGLDRPLLVQYFSYLGDLLHGNFGTSLTYSQPVGDLVVTGLKNTAVLGLSAFLFAAVTGVTLGLATGMRNGGALDKSVRMLSLLGQSVPSFWLGILLILLFAVNLNVLPAVGYDGFRSLILPAIALGAFPLAAFTRLTRSSVIELSTKDQTLFVRSKGVSSVVVVGHILKNAALPVVTLAGVQLGALMSGSVVIEVLFSWPGTGQLAIQAITQRDYALIQGIVIANATVFIVLLFLVDLSYGLLDPRIRRTSAARD